MSAHLRARGGRVPVVLVALLLVLLADLGVWSASAQGPADDVDPAVASPVHWEDGPPSAWPAPPPASARAYVLVDAQTGQVLASRAADTPTVVASTVKLLTILTALESLSYDDTVDVGEEAAVGGAGTGVDPGERWRVEDLVDAVLVRSGNDAAYALAAAASDGDLDAFVARMEGVAADLGLEDVTLTEPTGLDDENRLSARDLATIARAALADDRIRASARKPVVDLPGLGAQEARNKLIGSYEGANGLKTGYTDLAGYCLVASARRDGRELVAVVLGAREDPARFEEAAALFDHAFERFDTVAYEPLRARSPGTWQELLPAGHTWAPDPEELEVTLTGAPPSLELGFVAGDRALGRARVSLSEESPEGLGGALADALYDGMRRAHVGGLWPDSSGTATTGPGSG